jgi:hypothetical protein
MYAKDSTQVVASKSKKTLDKNCGFRHVSPSFPQISSFIRRASLLPSPPFLSFFQQLDDIANLLNPKAIC